MIIDNVKVNKNHKNVEYEKQETLDQWTSSCQTKNRNYKAPLNEYLTRNNFPFAYGKRGGIRIKV